MADSGFFARLNNLWSGFLSLFVSSLEKENPEAVYEAAINARKVQYKQLKSAVSGIIVLRNKLQAELEDKEARLKEIDAQVAIAVDTNEDEAAMVLLQQKEELQGRVGELSRDLEKAKEEAEKAKSSIMSFQSEIEKLEREKVTMLARQQNAQARIQIQDALSGMSMQADLKALDTVRDHIGKLQAEADVTAELGDSDINKKLEKIRAQTGQATARSKLEALKKAREAERGGEAAAVKKSI